MRRALLPGALALALGAVFACAHASALPSSEQAAASPRPAPTAPPVPPVPPLHPEVPATKAPLPNVDRALGAWAADWFPWGDGEIGVEKGARSVEGWTAFKVTKKYPAGFEDRADVLVSADGRTALVGNAFVDEERAASPAPVGADLSLVREFVKARVLGPGMSARVRRAAGRELPGFVAISVGIETGYGEYQLPAYVSEKDGALVFLGRTFSRGRSIVEQRKAEIDLSDTPSEGAKDARVTLVEYSDMQCPMCKRRSGELAALLEKLNSELPVRRYVKTYPLTQIHPWAFRAASAARCFFHKDPKLFFSFKSGVFARQEQLDVASLDAFVSDFAAANGAAEALNGCYLADANDAPILRDLAEGFSIGVRSTPTYVVDGVLFVWMDEPLLEEFLRKTYLGGKGLPVRTPAPAAQPSAQSKR